MPVVMLNIGERRTIKRIGGSTTMKKHLGSLGFIEGSEVVVISGNNGNLILGVNQSRIAVGEDLARKIFV